MREKINSLMDVNDGTYDYMRIMFYPPSTVWHGFFFFFF